MNTTKNYTLVGMLVIIGLLFSFYLYRQIFTVPTSFPVGKSFTINENEPLRSVSERLYQEGYITSPLLFRITISFLGKERVIQLGGYVFDRPLTLFEVVNTLILKRPTLPLLSVTIPEGSTSQEVTSIISKTFPKASAAKLSELIVAYNAEGKLFPSTYFLLPSYSEEDIIKLMLSTFTKKVSSLFSSHQVVSPLTSIDDVLVMASILEGEAKTEEDMKIVAGILLTRLKIGMPLQVDVAMETYKQKGLPEKPINNPGLVAIMAVLTPIYTDNLYYITGNDGNMYYAKTFDEHKRNIRKYLK